MKRQAVKRLSIILRSLVLSEQIEASEAVKIIVPKSVPTSGWEEIPDSDIPLIDFSKSPEELLSLDLNFPPLPLQIREVIDAALVVAEKSKFSIAGGQSQKRSGRQQEPETGNIIDKRQGVSPTVQISEDSDSMNVEDIGEIPPQHTPICSEAIRELVLDTMKQLYAFNLEHQRDVAS